MTNTPGRLAKALALAACPALFLAGCGQGGPANPEPPTMGEKQALEDAAAMLDERPDEDAPTAAPTVR